ncbi:6,7-dimethyl-8-ribityllumazine synthase [bioreactor metagenome]|uniref:6,7-dimethyl-8-ribityllumazine synthase n=1 Tax=bioreactor metagenome TaxID=1076179 RepID=A0A644X373_9ZZZZ
MKFAIVVADWNSDVTYALLSGANGLLLQCGAEEENIQIIHVPGSFELPVAAEWMARKNCYDAVICLGCVIQGETRHFDFISQAVAQGIMQVGVNHATPVIFGVLTTDNMEQAKARAGGKHGNKGVEAAATAILMVSQKKLLR